MTQSLEVKRLSLRHCFFLFNLRNSVSSRIWFENQEKVNVLEHLKWFFKLLTNQNSLAFVCEQDGVNLGVIYVCGASNSYMISVNVAERYRGLGVASSLLASVQREAKQAKIPHLLAKVKKGNFASINLFLRENFFVLQEDSEFFWFRKNI